MALSIQHHCHLEKHWFYPYTHCHLGQHWFYPHNNTVILESTAFVRAGDRTRRVLLLWHGQKQRCFSSWACDCWPCPLHHPQPLLFKLALSEHLFARVIVVVCYSCLLINDCLAVEQLQLQALRRGINVKLVKLYRTSPRTCWQACKTGKTGEFIKE